MPLREMLFRTVTVLGMASGVACGSGAQEEGALPGPVARELESVAQMCREVQGKPLTGSAVQRADLNGDGQLDYVLDAGAVQCEGAATFYGDRAKPVSVHVGDGRSATPAFSDLVYGVSMDGAEKSLWLTVSGEQCGEPPARDFASETFCDRRLVWNGATRQFDYAPVTTVRRVE